MLKNFPIMLALCFMLSSLYYAENYAGIIDTSLPHTKYLGITIDHKLSWNEHIQRIVNKAIQANTFLHRDLRHCPINIKCACYKSMVRSIIEFASQVWYPYTITNINKFEAIQRAAARFCFNDFSR